MPIIYEPAGKAKEYCDLAVNLYRGCSHGCLYCYAPAALRMRREEFAASEQRKDIISRLEKEAPAYRGREIHLCFTCDPYQPIDTEFGLTRKAIQILQDAGLTIKILTKGGVRSMRDFDLLRPGTDWYGATLTFTGAEESALKEPEAATPQERFAALASAHARGINTWASLEPVINPAQTLEIIRLTHKHVKVYKVGKLNYDPAAQKIDWAGFASEAVGLLKKLGCEYYIKKDLAEYL